ncbi:MAG: hypothetical protein ABI778_06470 [Ignavibacteriota bacterium]
MEYPQLIKDQAYKRSTGKCECTRTTHTHTGRCNTKMGQQNWYVHSKSSLRSREDISLENAEVICSPCHEARQTLGIF